HASHVGIVDDAVSTMRISGRSCMSFYTRLTKIRCVRCVQRRPVDAYLKDLSLTVFCQLFQTPQLLCSPLRIPVNEQTDHQTCYKCVADILGVRNLRFVNEWGMGGNKITRTTQALFHVGFLRGRGITPQKRSMALAHLSFFLKSTNSKLMKRSRINK
ncbi:hypothetical protein SFRURICE_019073, partial [Spodoptera frugiperda]